MENRFFDSLEEDLEERSLYYGKKLKQNVKSNLMEIALQTAKMEGKHTKEEVVKNYIFLCKAINPVDQKKKAEKEDVVSEWIKERCDLDIENLSAASTLYNDFFEWHKEKYQAKPPTSTYWGRKMRERFNKHKKNGSSCYEGVCLIS